MSPDPAAHGEGEPLELTVLGLRVAAKVWGPPDGVKVLGLHGWLDNAATFDRLAPLLPAVRLVAVDLPGHGLSQHKPESAFYHFVDWISDVAAIADALGWDRFALLGHSMGAGIASLLPGAAPERISRVVLLEGIGPMSSPPEDMPVRVRAALADQRQLRDKRLRPYGSRDEAARVLKAGLGAISDDGARLLVERGTQAQHNGVVWRADPRLRATSPMRFVEAQALAFLRAITCPVLLIRAASGYPFDEGEVSARLAAITDLRVVKLPGGHHVHLDDPQAVAAAIVDFLAS
jgi:pimeloyl-ACP methyl ester carboxylesterase